MIQLEGDRNAVGQKYFASSFVMLQRIYSRNNLNFLNPNRPSPLNVVAFKSQAGSGGRRYENQMCSSKELYHEGRLSRDTLYLHMGIFDELYPGVKKSKVQDGNFFEMGTSREAFGAP